MTEVVNTILMDMPGTIAAYTVSNADMSYTIVLNARLSHERLMKAYLHEMKHIKGQDYDKHTSVDLIECYAHEEE